MLETLLSIDRSLFFFLNGLHSSFVDPIMFWGTQSLIWLPLYLFLLYLVIRQYKWQSLWILLFAAIMILVSDQLSNVFKDWLARPRPTFEPGLTGIHTVNGYTGGQNGFYSAHASNTLAIAIFLILILQSRYKYFMPLILFWAAFMSYTRIYLGVHYPLDIFAGWLAGSLIGFCAALLCLRVIRQAGYFSLFS
jgi:undecaprenyl-diphosphatase